MGHIFFNIFLSTSFPVSLNRRLPHKDCLSFVKYSTILGEVHKKAVELEKREKARLSGASYGACESSALKRAFSSVGRFTPEQEAQLKKLFDIAYLLGYKGRPYTDFKDFVNLEKLHGVDFLRSDTYENETSCRDFINYAAQSIFDKDVRVQLQQGNFVSVLCDGSTDSAIIEKECIYLLYVDTNTFTPQLSFLSLQSPLSQDAIGIFNAIRNALEEKSLNEIFEKIVFLCSDGASVNSSLKRGLISCFKEQLPWVAFTWCISHRLELALKDA